MEEVSEVRMLVWGGGGMTESGGRVPDTEGAAGVWASGVRCVCMLGEWGVFSEFLSLAKRKKRYIIVGDGDTGGGARLQGAQRS